LSIPSALLASMPLDEFAQPWQGGMLGAIQALPKRVQKGKHPRATDVDANQPPVQTDQWPSTISSVKWRRVKYCAPVLLRPQVTAAFPQCPSKAHNLDIQRWGAMVGADRNDAIPLLEIRRPFEHLPKSTRHPQQGQVWLPVGDNASPHDTRMLCLQSVARAKYHPGRFLSYRVSRSKKVAAAIHWGGAAKLKCRARGLEIKSPGVGRRQRNGQMITCDENGSPRREKIFSGRKTGLAVAVGLKGGLALVERALHTPRKKGSSRHGH
jgi:hypothetical protein